MSNKNLSLKETLTQLQSFVEQQDWENAEVLDRDIRESIKEAVSQLGEGEDSSELIDILKKTQGLYEELITNSKQARSKFSEELKKISNDNKAANFYLKSSQYR